MLCRSAIQPPYQPHITAILIVDCELVCIPLISWDSQQCKVQSSISMRVEPLLELIIPDGESCITFARSTLSSVHHQSPWAKLEEEKSI